MKECQVISKNVCCTSGLSIDRVLSGLEMARIQGRESFTFLKCNFLQFQKELHGTIWP